MNEEVSSGSSLRHEKEDKKMKSESKVMVVMVKWIGFSCMLLCSFWLRISKLVTGLALLVRDAYGCWFTRWLARAVLNRTYARQCLLDIYEAMLCGASDLLWSGCVETNSMLAYMHWLVWKELNRTSTDMLRNCFEMSIIYEGEC